MKRTLFITCITVCIGTTVWAQSPRHEWGALLESVNPFSHNAGFLGVVLEDLTEEKTDMLGLESPRGALIRDVASASAAEEAWVQPDDVVISWDGVSVRSAAQMNRLVKETPPGRKVDFTVFRSGAEKALSCHLQERNVRGMRMRDLAEMATGERDEVPETLLKPSGPKLGVVVMPMHEQLAKHFGVEGHGVLVSSVQEDSVAGRVGIKAGDVLVTINDQPLRNAADITRLLVQHQDEEIQLGYVRDKEA